jgi:hypothetical protein
MRELMKMFNMKDRAASRFSLAGNMAHKDRQGKTDVIENHIYLFFPRRA